MSAVHLNESVIGPCRRFALAALALLATLAFGSAPAAAQLKGHVKVDGSSTVAPATMAAAELYAGEQPRVRVTVGISGTGGGFKKFLTDRADLRTDINDASRAIKESERERAKELGIEVMEIPIAIDGLAVVVHPANQFAASLTIEELKRIWEPGSTVNNWKDVRDGFPDLPLKLFGPGTDSGTFDYFTEAVVGKSKACRSDFTGSEDDNVLVQGVAGDEGGLGYFGYSYYEANRDKLHIVAIDNGDGKPVAPNPETVRDGSYHPLSRPLFLYVNKASLRRPEVMSFLEFYLGNAKSIVEHPMVNYVALGESDYEKSLSALKSAAGQ